MSNLIGTFRGSTVSMCTETGAGAAGAAASCPQPTSSPTTISAAKPCAAYEDNRRKSGFVSFSNGGMVGKEERQLRIGGSAQEQDYYTIAVVCKLDRGGADGATNQAGIRADEAANTRCSAARVRALRRDAHDTAAHRGCSGGYARRGLLAFRQQAHAFPRDA